MWLQARPRSMSSPVAADNSFDTTIQHHQTKPSRRLLKVKVLSQRKPGAGRPTHRRYRPQRSLQTPLAHLGIPYSTFGHRLQTTTLSQRHPQSAPLTFAVLFLLSKIRRVCLTGAFMSMHGSLSTISCTGLR